MGEAKLDLGKNWAITFCVLKNQEFLPLSDKPHGEMSWKFDWKGTLMKCLYKIVQLQEQLGMMSKLQEVLHRHVYISCAALLYLTDVCFVGIVFLKTCMLPNTYTNGDC